MRNERVFLKHGLRAVTMAMKTPIAVLGGIGAVALACVGLGIATMVHASSTVASNPVVQLGSGSVSGLGTSHVTVNQATQSLALTWASLGNQHGEVLRFIQPSASAVALNRVIGSDPSQFLGSLIANGSVIVINPNGVFIGPGSQVNVNGLIASTLNMTNASFLSGQYAFQGPATSGIVKNEGQITAGPYGVYLLAPNVTNNGVITSPGGHIALAAGTTAYLSDRPDGRGFLVEVKAPAGEALNLKSLIADGGQVSMIGRLVTQSGLVQANTVKQQNGTIQLIASDRLTLSPGSVTKATGDANGISNAGSILAKADLTSGQTTFNSGAVVDVSGGANGGNGGSVEISGVSVTLGGQFLGRAAPGYKGGSFLIDPITSTVTTADLQSFSGSGASTVTFQSPAGTDLTVSAQYNLAPDPMTGAGWALPVGQTGTLQFLAGNNLVFSPGAFVQNGSQGVSSAKWNYQFNAVNDITFNSNQVFTGGGGSLALTAGRDIKLGPDTTGVPTILQTFTGNMSIAASRDLIAPSAAPVTTPGILVQYSGIRLEGTGDLTITTGRDFLGGTANGRQGGPGFVLSDGTASVTVGGTVGSATLPATLTVGDQFPAVGSQAARLGVTHVNITAQNNIYLGLVQDRGLVERIPGFRPSARLTANPNSSVNLLSNIGNIVLEPPSSQSFTVNGSNVSPSIYPASFFASAPNGNISIQDSLTFWSSPVGTLTFQAGQSIQGISAATTRITLGNCSTSCNPVSAPSAPNVSPITLTAGGDISNFRLELVDSYRKTVTISAGGSIKDFTGLFAVPNLGRDAAGHVIPAVTITAKGDLDLANVSTTQPGLLFGGTGLARVTVGGSLNLGTGPGIVFQVDPHFNSATTNVNLKNQGGLLDIAVGGNTNEQPCCINMTQSRIITQNGADLFIHGLTTQTPITGTTAAATSGIVGVSTVNGQSVLAVGGVPIAGPDGMTPIPVGSANQSLIGNSVYLVGGRAVLDGGGQPIQVGANDAVVGKSVLVVGGTASVGINGKPVVVDTVSSAVVSAADLVHGTAVLDRPLVQLVNGTVVLVIDGKTVLSVPSGAAPIDGRPRVTNGTVTLQVGGQQVTMVNPAAGNVNVGTNLNSPDDLTGILTVRGGAIDVKSIGDINVNLSRIATLGGGNITLTSTTGDINAGSGARTDVTQFTIVQPGPRPGSTISTFFSVPGSGIFTFSPTDGNLPNIPPFNPLSPLEAQIALNQFLGHDVSQLLPQVPAAHAAWVNQYQQSVEKLFAGFQLGDINLTAAHDVIVPPAGIRGRNVTINAGHDLQLNGGQIRGITNVNVGGQLVGSLTSFVGVFAVTQGAAVGGTSNTLTLGSLTGTVGSVTTTSAVVASSSTSSAVTNKATGQAESFEPVTQKAGDDRAGKKGSQLSAGSLRVKDKVKIKVETKPEGKM